ncbi:unnamed protein product [Closterium sp. NIES-65]|nr:unnamed protein product [Closterium sp. NIES-65]
MVARRIPPVVHSAVPSPLTVSSHTHCAPAAARAKHRPAAHVPALPCGALCPSSIRPFPHPPPPSLSPLCFPQYLTSSSSYFLSPSAAARSSFGTAADYSAIFPPPLVSPLIGAAADYSAIFPPPLVSPLIGAAADYFAIFPPPLVSPRIGSAADYSATFPPPLVSPLSGSAADYPTLIPPPLIPLPISALQLFPPPHGDLSRPPLPPSTGPSACARCGSNLWFVTQQSGYGAIPTSPSGPTSSSSDPYADGLHAAIAETERLVTTAQATATAAPNNAAARDLACILAESLESTRKRLTEHLAAPSPRFASTPISSAPSHYDLLADWHVANARACQVIVACLPPTLLPQCSHIRYAKDLLSYLTERFQSLTPISVIALLRELTSLRLADFTTMADYIARVQTLSSQLASQKFELSDHVCGALLITGLTPEYSVHVTLYGEHPTDQWSFSRVSAFLLQAELNLRSCPPTAAAVTPSSAPPSLPTSTAAAASSRPRNTFPPCTYIIRHGPRKGQPCGRTNHPASSCFQYLTDDWFLAGNTGRPPNWLQLSRQRRQSSA